MVASTFLRSDATFAAIGSGDVPFTTALLATLTASNSTSLDDTTHITAAYDEYMFVVRNFIPATNSVGLNLRISEDGGSTYKTTGYLSIITGALRAGASGGAGVSATETATDAIMLSGRNVNLNGLGSAASGYSGTLYLHAPNGTGNRKHVTGNGMQATGAADAVDVVTFGGWYDGDNGAINAVRFLMSAGNITSGTIKIYGVAT